jgi:hypothetical protein
MKTHRTDLNKIKEFVDEILKSASEEDLRLKKLDKSVDIKTFSRTIHLARTLKEYLNED